MHVAVGGVLVVVLLHGASGGERADSGTFFFLADPDCLGMRRDGDRGRRGEGSGFVLEVVRQTGR